jgi:fucose 4-O-acetylase-like acetyltransferase
VGLPREAYLDNIKAILVTLVVVGHFIESLSGRIPEGLYVAIYSFHMPAFAALTGYLSRHWEPDGRRLREILAGLIAPFVIFQVILGCEFAVLTATPFPRDLLTPRGATWFLLALAWWRLGTPVLRLVRYPVVFAAAVSVLAPLDPNLSSVAAISRTLGFLPFFVVGLTLRPAVLGWLRRTAVTWASAAVLAGILAAGLVWGRDIDRGWLYLRSHYSGDDGAARSILIRLAVLAVGMLGAAAIAGIAARGRHWFTAIGANSLSVYLVHLVVLMAARWVAPVAGILRGEAGAAVTVGVAGAAVALTCLLGAPPVARLTRWLTHPGALVRWATHPDPLIDEVIR